jgi:hypothetical protein
MIHCLINTLNQGLQDPTDNLLVHNLVETAKRQPRPPKSKKDYVTESLIELCTKYKDSNELTVNNKEGACAPLMEK